MSATPPPDSREDAFVLLLDPDGWIEMVGPGAERSTGWPTALVQRKNFEVFDAHGAAGPVREGLARAMAAGLLWRCEGSVASPSGVRIPCRITVHPLHDEGSKHRRFVCTIRPPLAERPRDEELEHARAAAQKASQSRNEFLRGMAHELRTPMNGLVGTADHLLAGELDPGQRADLVTLRRSAGELLSVVSELLEFAGLEDGSGAAEHVPFRLRALLRELDAQVLPEARHRDLAWEVDLDPRVPDWLEGDPGRLRHVLGRLADNALRFTERGSVRLSVRLERDHGGEARVAFELADTGIGMPEEQQRTVHEPTGRGIAAPGRRYGGAGLGLTLAARQVESMGGRLALRSRVGHGTTFSFVLDLRRVAGSAPVAGGLGPDTRVLLVAGGPGAHTDSARMLRHFAANLDEAPSIDEAADRLLFAGDGAERVQALVIDARGAAFDPFEVASTLASAAGTPVPTLLLVTTGQRGDAERCRELGIGGYLTSPVTEADLRESLAILVAGGTLPARPAAVPSRPVPVAAVPLVTRHSLREARRTPRALVVDDHGVNRTVAERLLERAGYDVEIAGSGPRALELFEAGRFDVVLLDLAMPGMDGLEVVRRLRERERARGAARTLVVAVTAHTLEADREAVRESGMDAFLPKPVEPDVLFDLLARRPGGAPLADGPRHAA